MLYITIFNFIIMRTASKEVYYQSWQEIQQTLKELTGEPHRFQQQTRNIVVSALGSDTYKGLLADRIAYYHQKSPLYWAEEVDQIVKLFSRNGNLLSSSMGIINCADNPVKIDPKMLPKCVLAEFPPRGDKNSTMLKSLRRERGEQYFINTWQWFWINIAYALVNLPEIEKNRTFLQEQNQDQMYYTISRNPLLQLVRVSLQDYNNAQLKYLRERMRSILELFVVDELLFSLKKDQTHTQFRYQLKSHHIATLFLLINSCRLSSGETFQKYHQYFQKTTQNFSKISSTKNDNLRNLMRTWIFLITREYGVDHRLIQQLGNANPQYGWYRLERCPHSEWIKGVNRTDISHKEIAAITATRNHIYRIIKNHSQWIPSFSFLLVLEQFYELDKLKLSGSIKKVQQKQEDEIIQRAFEKTLCQLAQAGVESTALEHIQKRLNDKFKWQQPIHVNFAERSEEAKQTLSKTSRENRNSLTYQNPRYRNVWEHPCQQNQAELLLRGTKWIANQVDKIIPGHSKRTNPCVNIRIFANHAVFWVSVIIFLLVIRVYVK